MSAAPPDPIAHGHRIHKTFDLPVLDHDLIDPPSLLEGLKFGDRVRFTIDVPKKAIVKIEKVK
jgi:hypothetical protein